MPEYFDRMHNIYNSIRLSMVGVVNNRLIYGWAMNIANALNGYRIVKAHKSHFDGSQSWRVTRLRLTDEDNPFTS